MQLMMICQGGKPTLTMTTWSDSDAALSSSTATTPRMKEKKQNNNISERMRGSEDEAAAAALVSAFATRIPPPSRIEIILWRDKSPCTQHFQS
jgi:hypothetical protein